MQMVRTRTADVPPQRTSGALPDIDDDVCAVEEVSVSGPGGRSTANAPGKVKGPARGRTAITTVDSSPERDHKKGRHRSESGSSSHSRSRSRDRRRRGRSSSSSASSPRRRKRINNFSSIRNVEKERARTRGYRTAGASAAVKIVQTEVQGPYFAP
mmetsp:Transcript_65190/g.157802  ORF Transcript_65190/g.157802 Transcript_65190/m.157802 type:complete len:156 (+) Transcript_65190:1-468(+)